MCVHQGTNFLVVVVVIKLPCCHVHAWMASAVTRPMVMQNKKRRSSGPQALSMSCRHVYESGMRARELYHGHAHHAVLCLATCM